MKTRSAKAKGKRLQNVTAEQIRQELQLSEMDVIPVPSSVNGMDLWLSDKARKLWPYATEVKNQEKLSIWAALKQAEDNRKDLTPLLVFSRNRSKTYVALEFSVFLRLVKLLNIGLYENK